MVTKALLCGHLGGSKGTARLFLRCLCGLLCGSSGVPGGCEGVNLGSHGC